MHLLAFFRSCVDFLFVSSVDFFKELFFELFLLLWIEFFLFYFLLNLFPQLLFALSYSFLGKFLPIDFQFSPEQLPCFLYADGLSINQQVDVLILQINMLHLILIQLLITLGETLVQFFNLLTLVSQFIYQPVNDILRLVILLPQILDLSALKSTHLLIL